MKKKLLLLINMLILCFLFASCRSTLNYMKASPVNVVSASKAIISGYFVSKEKQNENDIVISGALIYSAWSSFVPFIGLRYRWEGTFLFSGRKQPFELVAWLVDYNTSKRAFNPVSPRKLPDSFHCKDFHVLSSRPQFSSIEKHKMIAEFVLNEKNFYVEFLPKYKFQGMDNHFLMLQDKNQIMQIVDESGRLYADFDMNSYRIYEQPAETSIEQLQMAISVFSVVQHLCLKLR